MTFIYSLISFLLSHDSFGSIRAQVYYLLRATRHECQEKNAVSQAQ